jgi:flagellar L-ring protein precursor FlgH
MRHFLLALCMLPTLAGCSTYMESRRSSDFKPLYDDIVPTAESRVATGAIFNANAKTGLFTTDQRARGVGDLLTVSFSESFAATKSQSTATSKSDDFSVTLPFDQSRLSGKLTAATAQDFSGSGQAAQSNSFRGQLSVSVVRVFANGNMEVMGQKMITLNNGNEYVRVRGIVRPEDISADNVVLSSKLADAEITYTGAGQIADTARMGWLSTLIRIVAPF